MRTRERRARAKAHLHDLGAAGVDQAVTCVFDENGYYLGLADRILDALPWRYRIRPAGHGLCVRLRDLATGLDPVAYAKLTQFPLREALLRLGFPRFLAEVLASAAAFGTKEILGALRSEHLTTTLTAVIPLVCPDLDRCPARGDVLKTYATPALATHLQTVAAGTG